MPSLKSTLKYSAFLPLLIVLGFWIYKHSEWQNRTYTISTGKAGGGYHTLGEELAALSTEDDCLSLSVLSSEGSLENIQRVHDGHSHFGLIQLHEPLPEGVKVVAPISHEVLHILIRHDSPATTIRDLHQARLSTGLPQSGTKAVAAQLLSHYGIKPSQTFDLPPTDALRALQQGQIDAALLVSAIHTPLLSETMSTGALRHLSLDLNHTPAHSAVGFCSKSPHFSPALIPCHTYGHCNTELLPPAPVSTIAIPSLLICQPDLPDPVTHRLASSLFAYRSRLSKSLPDLLHLTEPDQFYSYHSGAEQYYQRKHPSFLVVYAEVIALIISVSVALWGGVVGLKKWIHLRDKNRIDVYYSLVNQSIQTMRYAPDTIDLDKERTKLYQLRDQAFDQLINEQLQADESFRIFQDLLRQALEELESHHEQSH